MRRRSARVTLAILGGLLVATFVAGVGTGTVSIPPARVAGIVWQAISRGDGEPAATDTQTRIVRDVRLPRVALAGLVGLALAAAGTVMQGIFRNPLAEPYLLGLSSGATMGAAAVIALGLERKLPGVLPFAAFAGSLLAVAIVYRIGRMNRGDGDGATLVLAGVALSALFASVTSFCIVVSSPDQTRGIVFWMMGGLAGAQWAQVWPLALVVAVCVPVLLAFARDLDALALGDAMAAHLGVSPAWVQRALLAAAALLTASCVAAAGTIGFIGLIVPHALRLVVGPDHRALVPAAALAGAILLIVCDTAARTLAKPTEIPVGILTALLGAPFFLYLLRRRTSAGRRAWAGDAT